MDSLETAVLIVATVGVVGGAAFVLHRELTAPGRRRVGIVRDVIEVVLPIVGLLALVTLVWSSVT
jgi:hypothetical protein